MAYHVLYEMGPGLEDTPADLLRGTISSLLGEERFNSLTCQFGGLTKVIKSQGRMSGNLNLSFYRSTAGVF